MWKNADVEAAECLGGRLRESTLAQAVHPTKCPEGGLSLANMGLGGAEALHWASMEAYALDFSRIKDLDVSPKEVSFMLGVP